MFFSIILFFAQGVKNKKRRSFHCGVLWFLVELLAILASSLGLLAALNAGALVMLTLTDLGQNTGLSAAALEALQSALQRLIFTNTNFRHFIFPSLRRVGDSPYT